MTERVRNQKVDILRGIAAVLMILGHSFIVYPVNIASVPWCAAIEHFIYTFHMELFFILAGYVYHCIGYKNYIRKKIERIALPYFVFGIGAMLLRAYGGSAINGTESIGEGIIKLLFRGGGYWFLYVLFLIFAIYPLIEKVLVNIKTEIATAILILIATQFIHFPAFFAIGTVIHYLPYFMVGHGVAKVNMEGGKLTAKTTAGVLSLLVYILLDIHEYRSGDSLIPLLHFIRAVAISYVLYIIVFIIGERNKTKAIRAINDILIDCGKYSLQLYLFNGFLLTVIRIIICNIFKVESPFIIVMAIWFGNVAITLTLCKCILPKVPFLAKICGIK